MEPIGAPEDDDYLESKQVSTLPLAISSIVPPKLEDDELYHVFISYSSTDYRWTNSLIHTLESHGLLVCYHKRDFTPGRTVLENMSDCIQESQKVLLVLSPEFVRSRWCLLEANMSLFRDCLSRKPMVPVLLEPAVPVPLHLCHLTYLEASDPDFLRKVLKVLCTPNQQLQGSTVMPFQPPSIYYGKALQPLAAINQEGLDKLDAGQFSDTDVPDQLRLIIEDQEKYRMAMKIVNNVAQNKVWLSSLWFQITIVIGFLTLFLAIGGFLIFLTMSIMLNEPNNVFYKSICLFFCVPIGLVIALLFTKIDRKNYIKREMQRAVGQANTILYEEKVLMGCRSNTKICLVYVSLDRCKLEFAQTFPDQTCAKEMFQRALLFFSPEYTCCLADRHFPFPRADPTGHLEGAVCFCQYVSLRLSKGAWS